VNDNSLIKISENFHGLSYLKILRSKKATRECHAIKLFIDR
jgi:hypothetical protein